MFRDGIWYYLEKHSDMNPYKYESFSYNGTNELYKLTKENLKLLEQIHTIKNPIFLALSAEDSTIDANVTLSIASEKFLNLSGIVYTKNKDAKFERLITKNIAVPGGNIIDFSHISIPFSENNTIYGKNAKTNYGCLHYENKSSENFNKCQIFDKGFFYGEISKDNLKDYPNNLSRLTYNPQYNDLIKQMLAFIRL